MIKIKIINLWIGFSISICSKILKLFHTSDLIAELERRRDVCSVSYVPNYEDYKIVIGWNNKYNNRKKWVVAEEGYGPAIIISTID